MKNITTRLRKLEDHAKADEPLTIRLEVVEDDGHGLTKHGKPYTPGPGVIILRPGGYPGVNDDDKNSIA